MLENLRLDIQRARLANVGPGWWGQNVKVFLQLGTMAVVTYRFGHWVSTLRVPGVRHVLLIPALALRAFSQLLTGASISPKAEIGPGFVVHTTYGIGIPPIRIGANFTIQTGAFIGYGVHQIGNNVSVGAGAKLVEQIRIGSNVVIAPNSLVITDVSDDVTVMGVPARIRLPRNRVFWYEGGRTSNGNQATQDSRCPSATIKEG